MFPIKNINIPDHEKIDVQNWEVLQMEKRTVATIALLDIGVGAGIASFALQRKPKQ